MLVTGACPTVLTWHVATRVVSALPDAGSVDDVVGGGAVHEIVLFTHSLTLNLNRLDATDQTLRCADVFHDPGKTWA